MNIDFETESNGTGDTSVSGTCESFHEHLDKKPDQFQHSRSTPKRGHNSTLTMNVQPNAPPPNAPPSANSPRSVVDAIWTSLCCIFSMIWTLSCSCCQFHFVGGITLCTACVRIYGACVLVCSDWILTQITSLNRWQAPIYQHILIEEDGNLAACNFSQTVFNAMARICRSCGRSLGFQIDEPPYVPNRESRGMPNRSNATPDQANDLHHDIEDGIGDYDDDLSDLTSRPFHEEVEDLFYRHRQG